jgi:hypothetical protein
MAPRASRLLQNMETAPYQTCVDRKRVYCSGTNLARQFVITRMDDWLGHEQVLDIERDVVILRLNACP